jgi:CheY-like chemotaxis protein
LQPRFVYLNDTVSTMEKMIRRLIGEDVRLESRLASDLRPVKADPGQIEQVLLNLVVNARDAMPSGGRLVVETRNTWLDAGAIREAGNDARQGEYVELSVSDTGSGINPDVAAHIFEPFFTTKEEGKGTGLGLSTVYGIVRQSGGYVAFDSALDRGTTFRVYFPVAEGSVETPATSSPAEPVRGHETILVAEDEEMVRTLICRVLRLHGYTVLETRNGPEALAVLKGHEGVINLLLSDIIMPGMYGPELAAQAVRHRPDLRILFVSGHADRFMAEQGGGDGAALILPKPFTPDVLTRAVRAALG